MYYEKNIKVDKSSSKKAGIQDKIKLEYWGSKSVNVTVWKQGFFIKANTNYEIHNDNKNYYILLIESFVFIWYKL